MTAHALLTALFPWAPTPLIAAALIVVAVAAALLVHGVAVMTLTRLFRRHRLACDIVHRTRSISRFALIIVALSIALPFAPVTARVSDLLGRALLAAFIVFLGWLTVVGINLAMDRYVARFRLDSTDNLQARKAVTQVRLLKRVIGSLVLVLTVALALMSFDSVRQFGVSLFASAGVAGIAAGLAARPLLENLIAGIQLAFTQPIRLGDVLIIEEEYGTVEEITATYVVLKLWDWRRLIVPLSYFFDKPFQNWTRTSASLMGSVLLYTDYTVPVDKVRAKAVAIAKASALWDGQVVKLQVNDAKDNVLELRVLVSARNSGTLSDLRAEMREKLIAYLQQELPFSLPLARQVNIPAAEPAAKPRVSALR